MPTTPTASYPWRWVHVFGLIALWMTVGWTLHLDGNAYLLLGVPLVVAFQLLVRRRPLLELWLQRATEIRLGPAGWFPFAVVAATPAWDLFHAKNWISRLWCAAAVFGALGVAFTVVNRNAADRRATLFGFCSAGLIGSILMCLGLLRRRTGFDAPLNNLLIGAHSFLVYLPVGFVLEEVAFRGALDAHLHQPGDSQPEWSAIALSAAWGLWHLPITRLGEPMLVVVGLGLILMVHTIVGVLLSKTWRMSGSLLPSALVHAALDAVRNALRAP